MCSLVGGTTGRRTWHSLGKHRDVDQDFGRQAHDRLRIGFERVVPMLGSVKPRVVFDRQVRFESLLDPSRWWAMKDGSVRVRGQERLEREGEELGNFVPVQVRLYGMAWCAS